MDWQFEEDVRKDHRKMKRVIISHSGWRKTWWGSIFALFGTKKPLGDFSPTCKWASYFQATFPPTAFSEGGGWEKGSAPAVTKRFLVRNLSQEALRGLRNIGRINPVVVIQKRLVEWVVEGGSQAMNDAYIWGSARCTNKSWRCSEEGDDIFSEWDVEDLENKEHWTREWKVSFVDCNNRRFQ